MDKPVFILSFFTNAPEFTCDCSSGQWAFTPETNDCCGLIIIEIVLPSYLNASLATRIIERRPPAKRLKILFETSWR